MDLGLGNLDDVRQFALVALQLESGDTQYDKVLAITGAGVAQRFEAFTNRKLSRAVGDQATFDARRIEYILPRYPVETITKLEMRSTVADDWADITTTIVQQDLSYGWIYFGCCVGDPICQCRCTYTGGYFYETLEPTDGGYPSAAPPGSFPVPPVLKHAWLMQTLHEFQAKDRLLPTGLKDSSYTRHDLRYEQMQLLDQVEETLAQFRRYSAA